MKSWTKLVLLRRPAFAGAAALLAFGSLRAQERPQTPAPTPPPALPGVTFPAQVDQVIVDAVVTDKKGKPVTNLRQDDFEVFEDGKPQGLVSFERVELPDKPHETPPPLPPVSSNVGPDIRPGRTFVVVFDDVHLAPFQAHRAKGAVAEFLKSGVREGDHVSLVATGGGAWWGTRMEAGRGELMALLKRLDGRYIPDMSPERMSDYEALRIHIYHDTQVSDRVRRRFETYGVTQRMQAGEGDRQQMVGEADPYVASRATDVYFQSVTRNRITLEVLERALNSLSTTKGRKSLILVSEGFIMDPNLDEFIRVRIASKRSNTAIYFLDTRGLGGMSVYATAQFGPAIADQDIGAGFMENIEASEGAEVLASETGGFSVKNTNDLGKGIIRIADENRVYYLLGYNPTNPARDGRLRKIQVKVAGKGLEVRARKSYYAPGGKALEAKPGHDPVMRIALDSPYELDEIPLRMTSFVFEESLLGKANVTFAADADLANFAFQEEDGRFVDTLEFMLFVAHRETGEYYSYPSRKMEMKLRPETRQRIASLRWYPLPFETQLELAPGGYQAKLVVRDSNAGRVGTVLHHFEVPDLTAFRASSLVITDTLQKTDNPEDKTPHPQVIARRSFSSGADKTLYCSFEVYGAAKEKQSGMPKVLAGYIIRRVGDGMLVTASAPTPIRPTSLGRLSRIVGTKFENVPAGDYELVLTLKDEISGKALEIKELFKVEASS